MAEQVKQWITKRDLSPGDKLLKESDLQKLFSVSKATMREALKSLEVQGLVTISTGPNGGATVAEVPFGRTLQFLQNYLFFKDLSVGDIYAVRRIIEPEIAVTSLPHLTMDDVAALERSIAFCAPTAHSLAVTQLQRQEDLNFHDILARANPNPLLRLMAQLINDLLHHVVSLGGRTTHRQYQRFGATNVNAHRSIVDAIRSNDTEKVRRLMLEHVLEAEDHVKRLQGVVEQKLLLDSEVDRRVVPSRARTGRAK